MNESFALAQYIYETDYDDLPHEAADVTKKALLDGIGVILGATTLGEGCRLFVELAKRGGGKPESTIIGFNARVPSYMAAFANGAMAHALDFEDAHEGALVHSNAAPIPAGLAVAEATGKTGGKELITALTLGSDIVCRLGLALKDNPLDHGWYTPPILGAFGATATASKLLGLTPEQIVDALSLCLCQATCTAEIVSSPRSYMRAVRDSFAAKSGVLSALLVKDGVRGFDYPIEGKAGLFGLFANGNYDSDVLLKDLGVTFESANIAFKPWPSCRGTHAYIQGAIELAREGNIGPEDIEAVKVVVGESPLNRRLCEPLERKRHPAVAIDAKFSIPFTVAVALVRGAVTLDHFTADALKSREVLQIAERVTCEVIADEVWKHSSEEGYVEMKLKDGEVKSRNIRLVYGQPLNPMDAQSLIAKFKNCASYSEKKIPEKTIQEIVQMVMNLEGLTHIGQLTEVL
ncbi:MAG TPA: MmgE/PrpD family protein [Syntrophorhabdaceae bacterium]|nr:MmgE/PrpD family protein [Syntrophorhabdaceae bacterium]